MPLAPPSALVWLRVAVPVGHELPVRVPRIIGVLAKVERVGDLVGEQLLGGQFVAGAGGVPPSWLTALKAWSPTTICVTPWPMFPRFVA